MSSCSCVFTMECGEDVELGEEIEGLHGGCGGEREGREGREGKKLKDGKGDWWSRRW